MTASPLLQRICQISLPVADLERAITFYRDTLGLRLRARSSQIAFLEAGAEGGGGAAGAPRGVELMLVVPERKESVRPSSIVYFEVSSVTESHASLAARGVGFEAAPQRVALESHGEIWLCLFRDPDRNVLGLLERRPGPVTT